MLRDDMDGRGYFMYKASISIYPVDSRDNYSWPDWLQTCTPSQYTCSSPWQTTEFDLEQDESFSNNYFTTIRYSDPDSGSSVPLERNTQQNLPGFTIYVYKNPHRWVYKETIACNADLRYHKDFQYRYNKNDRSTEMCSRDHQFHIGYEQKFFLIPQDELNYESWVVSIGDWFGDSEDERPHMPVYLARNGFTPLVQFKMWVDEDVTKKQRFILRSRQYAKMVYRWFGKKIKRRASRKYKHITVDFSKVGN